MVANQIALGVENAPTQNVSYVGVKVLVSPQRTQRDLHWFPVQTITSSHCFISSLCLDGGILVAPKHVFPLVIFLQPPSRDKKNPQ